MQARQIETFVDDDCRHAGAAVGARHRDAIDVGLHDARTRGHRLRHFAGRDVLALPAKGVADPVDEIEKAASSRRIRSPVRNQASPGSNTSRRIFFRESCSLGVALEAAADVLDPRSRASDPADRLADLVGGAADAEPVRIAHRLAAVDIEPDQRGRQAVRQERRNAADRAGLAFGIVEREIAFGRGIEFEDLRNPEAVLERRPTRRAASRCRRQAGCDARARADAAAPAPDSGRARRYIETACSRSRAMSSQNWRAENFSRITTEPPLTSTAPIATMPPTL